MNWCAYDSISHLLDNKVLLKTQLVLTDDDPQFYRSFQSTLHWYKSKYGELRKQSSCK